MEEQSQNCFQENLNIRIAVIGLGFVGLPLAMLLINKGFYVTGIDVDDIKVSNLNEGISYLPDIKDEDVKIAISSGKFLVTNDYDLIKDQNVIIICVPTPLTSYGSPDLSYLQEAAESITKRIQKHQLVILESSTYPGTTKEVLRPILEKSNLCVGHDIFLSYSPERIDPGNDLFQINQIPKVVSGLTPNCEKRVYDLYSKIYEQVILVNSTEIAELTKLLENSYRFVNISFINEFSMLCDKLNVNVWDVIDAASTKPYGFQPFYPGPGIGGHCIPVDPLYLYWKAKQHEFDVQFLQLSNQINHIIPSYIVKQITKLIQLRIPINEANILIYGVAYKKNISDSRESPASDIISSLLNLGAQVQYHDPFVPEINIYGKKLASVSLSNELLQKADCLVILTDHSLIPIQDILDKSKLIYDTKNVTKGHLGKAEVYRLGGGDKNV
ncbi:nucleotide sugar dehydrogenase [Priestia aryabhattai]|uniref:nucleotide sugar dehydrogenase n=1 Tax=Priestia aryabhattai TaxID=412384 RepID=UPI001C8E8A59|nr:nucleotide sugar dehydrogenase [Priestia aryabhattai]MBX9988349.1 nucleotide sugar dehydrogenase [Priestia aryabhattai]